jgi:hypothetical protein
MGNVEKLASRDGQKNLEFQDCDEYASQMKLSEDKVGFLNNEKEKRETQLKVLREERDKNEKEYLKLQQLINSKS